MIRWYPKPFPNDTPAPLRPAVIDVFIALTAGGVIHCHTGLEFVDPLYKRHLAGGQIRFPIPPVGHQRSPVGNAIVHTATFLVLFYLGGSREPIVTENYGRTEHDQLS